jgi:hypothetical protein
MRWNIIVFKAIFPLNNPFKEHDIFVYPRLVLHKNVKQKHPEKYWNKLFKNVIQEESNTCPALVRWKKKKLDALKPEYAIGRACKYNANEQDQMNQWKRLNSFNDVQRNPSLSVI